MGNIIKIADYNKNKITEEKFGRQRVPLYVSHKTGKITGDSDEAFGNKIERINAHLKRLSELMAEIKGLEQDAIDGEF